ncbi:cell division protein FtsA [Ligilactobacillus sp. Marseille-Q7487]|uniref:cell division protein FtsA n=1 Tax=Ligilactobacillus sp. Marseille-Q7487 TaxID=3022128 RepID=UPI0024A85FCE|nr:cell division protein FtsA [Ligilactobacillus sp. Marseille-Q7487]
MENSGIYVGLDIGTTSIKVIIAEYVKNQLNIIGYGNARSNGLRRGVIVDIDQAVSAIKAAIKQAEEKASVSISQVTVGVPANMLQIEQCKGIVAVSAEDGNSKEIDDNDVRRVTEAALVQNLPPERDVIDIVPDEFIVDGFDGIKDPRGMVGVRMEMHGVMYTGPRTILHNTKKCIEKAGLVVKNTVVAPIALSEIALNDGEKDFGAILIDLGGGQTTAAVVHDHKLKYTYVDQEGGDYVTRDISVVLNTSIEDAENLKRNYGYALAQLASSEDFFPVQVVGQQEPEKITERYLAEIIEARMYQIFSKMRNALEKINALQLPGGIILTGGMAALPGVKELAQDVFGVNVKIYVPQEMNLRIPSFAQVIGLISHITNQSEINMVVKGILDGQEALEASTNIQITNNESHKVYEQTTKQDDMPKEEKSGLFSKVFNGFKGMFNDDE